MRRPLFENVESVSKGMRGDSGGGTWRNPPLIFWGEKNHLKKICHTCPGDGIFVGSISLLKSIDLMIKIHHEQKMRNDQRNISTIRKPWKKSRIPNSSGGHAQLCAGSMRFSPSAMCIIQSKGLVNYPQNSRWSEFVQCGSGGGSKKVKPLQTHRVPELMPNPTQLTKIEPFLRTTTTNFHPFSQTGWS